MSDIKSAPQWDETLASDSEADVSPVEMGSDRAHDHTSPIHIYPPPPPLPPSHYAQ